MNKRQTDPHSSPNTLYPDYLCRQAKATLSLQKAERHYKPQAFPAQPVHLLQFEHRVHPSSPTVLIVYLFNENTNPHKNFTILAKKFFRDRKTGGHPPRRTRASPNTCKQTFVFFKEKKKGGEKRGEKVKLPRSPFTRPPRTHRLPSNSRMRPSHALPHA